MADELDEGTRKAKAPRPKRGGGRITRRLVALSSAAILSVYAVGLARTAPAADQIAAQEARAQSLSVSPPIATVAPVATAAPVAMTADSRDSDRRDDDDGESAATVGRSALAVAPVAPAPTATVAPAPTATQAAGYRDGQYAGQGSSRHGDVEALVVIKNGKIASAAITGCQTRYPCSIISSLPGEVVARQSVNVDLVSGATDSSSAYLEAIQSALAQAGGAAS